MTSFYLQEYFYDFTSNPNMAKIYAKAASICFFIIIFNFNFYFIF